MFCTLSLDVWLSDLSSWGIAYLKSLFNVFAFLEVLQSVLNEIGRNLGKNERFFLIWEKMSVVRKGALFPCCCFVRCMLTIQHPL